jgi:hypothetical protein
MVSVVTTQYIVRISLSFQSSNLKLVSRIFFKVVVMLTKKDGVFFGKTVCKKGRSD